MANLKNKKTKKIVLKLKKLSKKFHFLEEILKSYLLKFKELNLVYDYGVCVCYTKYFR